MRKILLIICIPFIFSNCVTCLMIKEDRIGDAYNIQIDSLVVASHHIFHVYGKLGTNCKDTVMHIDPFWHLDAYCRKGDILLKDSGKIDIKLVRKDTTIIIPFECKDFL